MTALILHVPAFDEAEARVIAESVARGETGQLSYHTDRAEVERICAYLNRTRTGARYQTFEVEVSTRATDDGRIKVGRVVDGAGEVAAAFVLICLLPFLAAASWGAIS